MILSPGGPFKWDAWGTEIFIVDADIDVYELESKVKGELEDNLYGGHLVQSSSTFLVSTRYHPSVLVYVVGFKLKHREEIVSY